MILNTISCVLDLHPKHGSTEHISDEFGIKYLVSVKGHAAHKVRYRAVVRQWIK